jgi:hypothetical protein
MCRMNYLAIRAQNRREISDVQGRQVAEKRSNYFTKNGREPHPWFKVLQGVMSAAGMNWSYANATAVHVDVVACATWREWGRLHPEAKEVLITNCFSKFTDTLCKLRSSAWLLLDGRTVFETVRQRCGAVLSVETEVGENPRLEVWRGHLSSAFGKREFLGWSNPVSKQKNQQPLVAWLRRQAR